VKLERRISAVYISTTMPKISLTEHALCSHDTRDH